MKRMKKMYSITKQTEAIIKELAREISMPESYALDNMAINYWRMTHKGKDIPYQQTAEEMEKELFERLYNERSK